MKKFRDFNKPKELEESTASVYEKLVKMNKGRAGKKVIKIDGEEMDNSVVLGDGMFAHSDSKTIKIVEFDMIDGKKEITMNKKEFSNLKRIK